MSLMTLEQFQKALPDKMRKTVNQELVDSINTVLSSPDMYEAYRDNLLSYMSVLNDGKYKIMDYVNAVKYCSNKLMGSTNLDAFIKTFPDRYNNYVANGTSSKDIASYITAYNKNKLVNSIMEQSLIPSWILNQDMYQAALNVQFGLMNTAVSEKVRSDAANSLLNHLRPPEVQKVSLDIGVKENSTIDVLRQTTLELVSMQRKMIEANAMTVIDVAESRIIPQLEKQND